MRIKMQDLRVFFGVCFSLFLVNARAEVLSLDDALRAAYVACVGINDKLGEYKTLAGINTAVSGVGTGLGVGATAVGIVKYSTDKEAESYEKLLEELRKKTQNAEFDTISDEEVSRFEQEFNVAYNSAVSDMDKYQSELDKLNTKSKNLGNWRTGLMAGSTATNVAGAILAAKSGANKDIQEMVDVCLKAVDDLNDSMMQARINGEDISEAKEIVSKCREYNTVDVSSISKRAKGAEISSIVGATTGATGTVLSAVANSDKIRNDNTDSGKKKEKGLNTASNVMAGTTTVASAASTVFSATQIAAVKRVAKVAEQCEGVLK